VLGRCFRPCYRHGVPHEKVQDLLLAADQRLLDGLQLLVEGRPSGGLYVLGYSAEMWLKAGFFYLRGAKPFDVVQAMLRPAHNTGTACFPTVPWEGGHGLEFWLTGIRHERAARGKLGLNDDARWTQCVAQLAAVWSVHMRYASIPVLPSDALAAYENSVWIQRHHPELWS
jgi:hypothetical protein